MKLVRRVIRGMLALWDCISSFPRFVMVNVGFSIDSTKYFTIFSSEGNNSTNYICICIYSLS